MQLETNFQLFAGKCNKTVSTILLNNNFEQITHQFLVCLCKFINTEKIDYHYLKNICEAWRNFLDYVPPNALKLDIIQTHISQL